MSYYNTSSYLEMLANTFDRAPDAAQAVASATSVAKAESIPQPAPWTDMIKENHELVKQNQAMAELNHVLVIVVQQAKSREQSAAQCYEVLEKSHNQLHLEHWRAYERHYAVLADLEVRFANNNAELISELWDTITTLQDTITTLEENVEVASWNEWRQTEDIHRLDQDWRSLLIGRDPASVYFVTKFVV